jgi:hypothetical protein
MLDRNRARNWAVMPKLHLLAGPGAVPAAVHESWSGTLGHAYHLMAGLGSWTCASICCQACWALLGLQTATNDGSE